MTALHTRWFEDVKAGDQLPMLEFTVSLTALVMYAGATWDFHRYHYDTALVAKFGMPAPFMDGQMMGALLARQLMEWGGRDAFVRKLVYAQCGMVYAGDRIVLRGTVTGTEVEDGRSLAMVSLSVTKEDGSEIVRNATAAVELTMRPR